MQTAAVFFDLDGTILDNTLAFEKIHDTISEKIRYILKAHDVFYFKKKIRNDIIRFHQKMQRKSEYDRDLWWPEIVSQYNSDIHLHTTSVKNLTKIYWQLFEEYSKPFHDTFTTLKYLLKKNYRLGLISDTDGLKGEKQRRITMNKSITKFFYTIVIAGEDTERTKIDPQPFLFAAEKVKIPPENCVYVGDTPYTDIQGAIKAKMKSILIYRGKWEDGIYPDYIISQLSDLKKIL
ncbi:HAD family hydrolase [[Eubacterium] cellulosolvens]